MGLSVCWRRQRDSSLGRERQERQCLLEVEAHGTVGVAQIPDRDVLPDAKVEITATRGEHEGTGNGRGPNHLLFDEFLYVLQHGIPIVAGLGEGE